MKLYLVHCGLNVEVVEVLEYNELPPSIYGEGRVAFVTLADHPGGFEVPLRFLEVRAA